MSDLPNFGGAVAAQIADFGIIEDLMAFDRLPAGVRRSLREAVIKWSAEELLDDVLYLVSEGVDAEEIAKVIAKHVRTSIPADCRACYGSDHPQANRNAPLNYFEPLTAKRTRIR